MRLDRAGWPFVLGLSAAALVLAPFTYVGFGLALVLLVFTLNFFRDPERRTPVDPAALISPADGKIIRADGARVSIFMNVFDVHVCRTPVGGTVTSVRHEKGRFFAAMKDEASEHNERTTIEVRREDGAAVRFALVAGLIARRIVCRVEPGRELSSGERVGIIRFGSRVDVDLPQAATATVEVGQRVVAGETVIARRSRGPA